MRYKIIVYGAIAEIPTYYRKSGSRNTMVMSDFRPKVEIWPFRACALNTQYSPCYRNNLIAVQLLWGRYHVQQHVKYTSICIAHFYAKRLKCAQTCITQFYLQITPCLPLLPSRRTSPLFGWYSIYRPTEGRRLSQPGWLVTYWNKVPPPGVEPVTRSPIPVY